MIDVENFDENECNGIKKVALFVPIKKENFEKMVSEICSQPNSEHDFVKYEELRLPSKGSKFSAGYDFYSPHTIKLNPGESKIVYTMMRCIMQPGYVLMVYPRSGLGFKYGLGLSNTVGIIDSDYYMSKTEDFTNEGNIMIKLVNNGNKVIEINKNDRFCQGIIMKCYDAINRTDDCCDKKRNGGLGSTGL